METHIVTQEDVWLIWFRYFHEKFAKYIARHATVNCHPMDQSNHRTDGQTQSYVFAALRFDDARTALAPCIARPLDRNVHTFAFQASALSVSSM